MSEYFCTMLYYMKSFRNYDRKSANFEMKFSSSISSYAPQTRDRLIPHIRDLFLCRPWEQFSLRNLIILLRLLAQLIQTIPRPLLHKISYFPLSLDLFHALLLLQAQEKIFDDQILIASKNANLP